MESERLLYRALDVEFEFDDFEFDEEMGNDSLSKVSAATHEKWGKVIVKIEKESQEFDEILHEGIIGLYAINSLRSLTSCFALVHQVALDVEMPVGKRSVVVYEEIEGTSLYGFLQYDALERIEPAKEILMTLLIGLNIAHHQIDFTHYDLHMSNIIVEELETPQLISHHCKPLFKTLFRPVIIDFGRSHVKIAGRHYGWEKPGEQDFLKEEKMHVRQIGFWQHDVFNILCSYYEFFSLDGRLAADKLFLEGLHENLENTQSTLEDAEENEVEELQENIKYWGEQIKKIEQRLKFTKSLWKGDTPEQLKFVQILISLISYFYPAEKFDYSNIIKKLGQHHHLVPNKRLRTLKFDEFLNYALELIQQ